MLILCDYCGREYNAPSISGGDPFDIICPECCNDADEEMGVEDDGSIGLEGTTIDSKLPKPQNS